MTKTYLADLDVVFISYDEANAESNWANLKNQVPWAKRSHGVHGSDAAHKAAAQLSDTEWFVGIDGDNVIDPELFNSGLELNSSTLCYSWRSYNIINGLVYGNGGVKLWRRQGVLNMQSHEHAVTDNPADQIEFCWDGDYQQMHNIYSRTVPNGSAYQAWRAGFREGVKLALDRGQRVSHARELNEFNRKNLEIWYSVGQDVEHGAWAMAGARQGTWMTLCSSWNYVDVRDFNWLKSQWETISDNNPCDLLLNYEQDLRRLGFEFATLSVNDSKFFKKHQYRPSQLELGQLETGGRKFHNG
jgi:hypothetical protein